MQIWHAEFATADVASRHLASRHRMTTIGAASVRCARDGHECVAHDADQELHNSRTMASVYAGSIQRQQVKEFDSNAYHKRHVYSNYFT